MGRKGHPRRYQEHHTAGGCPDHDGEADDRRAESPCSRPAGGEGEKQAAITRAEGAKESAVLEADGAAQARLLAAGADAQAIANIAQVVGSPRETTQYLITSRYIDS